MTAWLLDTNVISELRRPRPDPGVVSFISEQALESLHISVVSLAEIRYGIERVTEPGRRVELSSWLSNRVRPMFENRILPISEEVMLTWRLLVEEGRKAGHTYSQPDLIIAATALQSGFTVVTRDISEFARARAAFYDPWRGET